MNTDERLDRLAERHEALTQSVEMLVLATRETRETVERLARIVELHERRPDGLEN
jgi:hypothetical protein